MHWTEVAGYPMPRLIGGHPGLELCNTWAGWGQPPSPRREWLADYDRFAVWSGHAGLLPDKDVTGVRHAAATSPPEAEQVLRRVRELRTALYRVLTDDPGEDAFPLVAAVAEEASAHSALVDGDGPRLARWELRTDAGLELPLFAAARAAAELLCAPERALVRACPGDDCGWLFLDRRGRRRWCSMEACGNRAKVKAYAARRRPG